MSEAAAASSDSYMCHQSLTQCKEGVQKGFMSPSPVSWEVSVTTCKHAEEVIKPNDSNLL